MFCCSQCGRKVVTNQDWLKLPQFPTAPPSIEPLCGSMSTYPLAQGRHTRANFQCAMLTWFTANSLFRHRALPLRIRVNQSLSRFSLSEWCDVEFHSDSTWSFSLPSWAVILLHKTAKLHVNNAGRCSKAPKEAPLCGVIESLRDSIWSFGLCFALTETFTFCSCNGGRNF